MKKLFILVFQKTTLILWAVGSLVVVTTAHATTHVIQFGGSFGFTYSPKSLNVSAGDTVRWEGDFTTHPLSSTSVPAGAQSFRQATGIVFVYPVAVAGTYLYHCDFHFSAGMTGSFTASAATGIQNDRITLRPDAFNLGQNYPNPFNPTTVIVLALPKSGFVTLKVFDLLGKEIATLVSEQMNPGYYKSVWRADVPSGTYFYRLETDGFVATKKMILLH